MGEPATPPPAERAATRQLATAIVEAVVDEEELPIGIDFDLRVADVRAQVEELVFRLAQEVTLLAEELAAKQPREDER